MLSCRDIADSVLAKYLLGGAAAKLDIGSTGRKSKYGFEGRARLEAVAECGNIPHIMSLSLGDFLYSLSLLREFSAHLLRSPLCATCRAIHVQL